VDDPVPLLAGDQAPVRVRLDGLGRSPSASGAVACPPEAAVGQVLGCPSDGAGAIVVVEAARPLVYPLGRRVVVGDVHRAAATEAYTARNIIQRKARVCSIFPCDLRRYQIAGADGIFGRIQAAERVNASAGSDVLPEVPVSTAGLHLGCLPVSAHSRSILRKYCCRRRLPTWIPRLLCLSSCFGEQTSRLPARLSPAAFKLVAS
jgi:hypothetical protein